MHGFEYFIYKIMNIIPAHVFVVRFINRNIRLRWFRSEFERFIYCISVSLLSRIQSRNTVLHIFVFSNLKAQEVMKNSTTTLNKRTDKPIRSCYVLKFIFSVKYLLVIRQVWVFINIFFIFSRLGTQLVCWFKFCSITMTMSRT